MLVWGPGVGLGPWCWCGALVLVWGPGVGLGPCVSNRPDLSSPCLQIVPCIANAHPAVRNMAVVCLGTSALHSKDLAKAHMVLLLQVRPAPKRRERFVVNYYKCTRPKCSLSLTHGAV